MPIPTVRLVFGVNTSIVGYWSDGTADVTLDFTLSNEGSLRHDGEHEIELSCIHENCEEQSVSLSLTDGYGPALGSFTLRLPMGVQTAVELDYGGAELVTLNIEVRERILGVEHDLWECYIDREPVPDPAGGSLHGCSGFGSTTTVKWLNDVPIKVWATGEPQYIAVLESVLSELAPILDLTFVWVEAEHQADFKAFMSVRRSRVLDLGFDATSVDYGGFAGVNTVSGETIAGYIVVWSLESSSWDAFTNRAVRTATIHEALHALVPMGHSTRLTSIMGGSGLNKWSPRDAELARLHAHHLIRPGMTVPDVESLIVFREELLDDMGLEPVTDPLDMVWRAYTSLEEAGSMGYKLRGGWTDRQCNRMFGVRRGPLPFVMGGFRRFADDPAASYFTDHRNDFFLFYSEPEADWLRYIRPHGGEWRFATWNQVEEASNWWPLNFKFHRALRGLIMDWSDEDVTVETTAPPPPPHIVIHATFNPSYSSVWDWSGVESLNFTIELSPENFDIEGYKWTMRHDPAVHTNACLNYEEVATDFKLGVTVEVPDRIPDSANVYQKP